MRADSTCGEQNEINQQQNTHLANATAPLFAYPALVAVVWRSTPYVLPPDHHNQRWKHHFVSVFLISPAPLADTYAPRGARVGGRVKSN